MVVECRPKFMGYTPCFVEGHWRRFSHLLFKSLYLASTLRACIYFNHVKKHAKYDAVNLPLPSPLQNMPLVSTVSSSNFRLAHAVSAVGQKSWWSLPTTIGEPESIRRVPVS